jgi:acyl-[acyl-carrier-protein] desaturase
LSGVRTYLTDRELLDELTFEVDLNLRRHIAEAVDWEPHDLVPWNLGRNFAFLGGQDWSPEQSTLGADAKLALTVGVLVADNIPAYHRELASYLRTGVWFKWVGRWTAEENRHAMVIRDYLTTTRAVDPVELERLRMAHMTAGMAKPSMHVLDILVEAALDETTAAIRHRNTAALGENPMVTAIAERIARDDELQAVFFANLVEAAFRLVPDQTARAVADRIAGYSVPTVPLADGRDSAKALADTGIYDPRHAPSLVFGPLLKQWSLYERADLSASGELARAELEHLLV